MKTGPGAPWPAVASTSSTSATRRRPTGRWDRFWRLFGKRFLFDHHDLSPEMYEAKFGSTGGLAVAGAAVPGAQDVPDGRPGRSRPTRATSAIAIERGGVSPEATCTWFAPARIWSASPSTRPTRPGARASATCSSTSARCASRMASTTWFARCELLRDELGRDDIHCVLVGGGPHQPSIEAYAEELGVADLCTFTGRVSDDELCRILSSADVGGRPRSQERLVGQEHHEQDHGVHVLRAADGRRTTCVRLAIAPSQQRSMPSPTKSASWPVRSRHCSTHPSSEPRWGAAAASEYAAHWPGNTRSRTCWRPTSTPSMGA